MRLLWIGLEFSAATFSGNGIYAQSQVRALSRLGHQVLVVCGKPQGHSEPRRLEGAVDLLEVELPVWGRLDAGCAWKEFAEGAAAPQIVAAVAAFAPEAVLGVDWHSLAAYEAMAAAMRGVAAVEDGQGAGSQLAPYVFMNYRVHLRTAEGADAELLSELERRALHTAIAATVLSRSDEQFLQEAFPQEASASALHVLLPALRSDMECLPMPADVAQQAQQQQQQQKSQPAPARSTAAAAANGVSASAAAPSAATPAAAAAAVAAAAAAASEAPAGGAGLGLDPSRGRYLLTCAVRISPEKEPAAFVHLAAELRRRGALEAAGVVPLMLGAGWGSEYGQKLRARLQEEVPECIVLDSFLGPSQLAAVYSATRLNIHPPVYDAFGMTIVEAASQGAPSLVDGGRHVGATDLLQQEAGEVLCADLSQPAAQLAGQVEALLRDPERLAAVGARAAARARSWTEEANAAELVRLVRAALQQRQ